MTVLDMQSSEEAAAPSTQSARLEAMGRGGEHTAETIPLRDERVDRFRALTEDCLQVIGEIEEAVAKADELGRPLRVKLGLDPTSPDIHLGHTVALQKMREFQDAGAIGVLIVGDYTALVGDPTGRNTTRPQLSHEQIIANAATYTEQAFKILDPGKTEVRWNGDWLSVMSAADMFDLLRSATLAQILARNDFRDRYEKEQPISMLEMVYPLLQGLDSVKVDADVELGGSDQLYNLTVGREMNDQVCLTMPILVGTDGVERMSKSKENYVGIDQSPEEMFGRIMRIPDEVMADYFLLVSGHPQRKEIAANLLSGEMHQGEAKRLLARTIITRYHSAEAATYAESDFDGKFVRKEIPSEMPSVRLTAVNEDGKVFMPELLKKAFSLPSGGEARRLLRDRAVKLDGTVVEALELAPEELRGKVLQAGKRRFVRLES